MRRLGLGFLFSVCPTSGQAGAPEPHSFLKSSCSWVQTTLPPEILVPPLLSTAEPPHDEGAWAWIKSQLPSGHYHQLQSVHNFHFSCLQTGAMLWRNRERVRRSSCTRCTRLPRGRSLLCPSKVISIHSLPHQSVFAQPSPPFPPRPSRSPSPPADTPGTAAAGYCHSVTE